MGVGMPLGALLGGWQWRAPFFTATLMAAAFRAGHPAAAHARAAVRTRLRDPLPALGHKGLRTAAGSAVFDNFRPLARRRRRTLRRHPDRRGVRGAVTYLVTAVLVLTGAAIVLGGRRYLTAHAPAPLI